MSVEEAMIVLSEEVAQPYGGMWAHKLTRTAGPPEDVFVIVATNDQARGLQLVWERMFPSLSAEEEEAV